MTYFELIRRADHLLDFGIITTEEWQDMVKPLRKEITDDDAIAMLKEILALVKSNFEGKENGL